ncbi:MAG: cytochrome c peroxidase [Blastocatellia bacterium]
MLKRLIAVLFAVFIAAGLAGIFARQSSGQQQRKEDHAAVVQLGERLFRDDRFSTPQGDLPANCAHCHLLDEDPQGWRAYTDFFNRSWVSYRSQDPRRLGLRNAPTILDAAQTPRLHYDGEFGSLEDLVKGTFSGRPMGWLPGEETQALDRVRAVVLNDKGEGAASNYPQQFKAAFDVEPEKLNREQIIDLIAKAVADFVRTLNSRQDAPYDRFITANGLERKSAAGESGVAFTSKLLAQISSLEAKEAIKLTKEFDGMALAGLKIFMRTDGAQSVGNCVACHTPPLFTDFSFHNIGISQREYDGVHGEGKFADMQIPTAAIAHRPSAQLREIPAIGKPNLVDLGFWNFVDLKTSTLRRAGENDDHLLQRMTAAFKTPTLRNLKYSQPYFHDGSVATLDVVMSEMIRLSKMARAGRVREGDEGLGRILITEAEIAPLVAFLNTLNEELKKGH